MIFGFMDSTPLRADTVILRNGAKLHGKIIQVSTGRHMIMRVRGRIRRIPLKDIRSLRKSPVPPRGAKKRPRARAQKKPPAKPIVAAGDNSTKKGTSANFPSPLIPWLPGLVQYREGRRVYGASLGTVFALSLLSSMYHAAVLQNIRRDADASPAYNLFLDRAVDNRFRRVRERLDWSRFVLLLSAILHGHDLHARRPAAKTGPRFSIDHAGLHFGFRFHFDFSRPTAPRIKER